MPRELGDPPNLVGHLYDEILVRIHLLKNCHDVVVRTLLDLARMGSLIPLHALAEGLDDEEKIHL